MAVEKLKELNQIKEELFALYPNAIKIQFVCEGDKITVTPTEKYEVNADLSAPVDEE